MPPEQPVDPSSPGLSGGTSAPDHVTTLLRLCGQKEQTADRGGQGLARVSLGSAEEIGLRLVAEGRFGGPSEACRAGLRRLDEDARDLDRLVALGMASGADAAFDIDVFVEETRAGA